MKQTKWPIEVLAASGAIEGTVALSAPQLEKIRYHINRLWLSQTPESILIYDITILAAAMEGKPCTN